MIDQNSKKLTPKLWHSKHAFMRIPSLAPHLKKDKNDWSWNNETHLKPIICTQIVNDLFKNDNEDFEMIGDVKTTGALGDDPFNLEKNHLSALLDKIAEDLSVKVQDIVDFELCLIDENQNEVIGLHDEFVSSERLDNMFCTMNAMEAMSEYYTNN